jgi:hypothetical protein
MTMGANVTTNGVRGLILGILAAVAASSGQICAAAPAASPVAVGVRAPWSIAGVTLGMRPTQVEAALKAAGYVRGYRYTGRSWQGEVANELMFLRSVQLPSGAEVVSKEDYGKGQEEVHVTYLPGQDGPYVARVDYAIGADAIDADRFKAAALAKYGRPSLRWDLESLYCSPGEPECSRTGGLVTNELPNLTVYVADVMKRSLHLRQGARADKMFDAAIRAEAERLYPKKDKPSF